MQRKLGKVLEKIKPFSILKPPWSDLNEELAEKLSELLSGAVGATSLLAELCVLREECNGSKAAKDMSIKEVVIYLQGKKAIYPASNAAFTYLLTAPVTFASNERSFSKLKLVKTKIRSTMLQDRLESLMMISCEHDYAKEVNLIEVVKHWTQLKRKLVNFSY